MISGLKTASLAVIKPPGNQNINDEGSVYFLQETAGAMGVVSSGSMVQVIVGPEADTIATDIEDLM